MSQFSVTLSRLITSLTLCYAPFEYFTKDLKSVEKVNEIHPEKKQKDFSDSLCCTQIRDCFCIIYSLRAQQSLLTFRVALRQCHCTWETSQPTPRFCHVGIALPSKWLLPLREKKFGFSAFPTKPVYYSLKSLIKKQEFNHLSLA